jgi:flagellar FliL protein
MAKKPEDTSANGVEAPKKKGKKLVLIAGVLVLALGGGGAGAWYFMRPADPHAEKAHEAEKPAQFLPLESFTVNLLAADGQPQYLQAGLTLKLKHDVKVEAIKERMPEIRNRMLLILSGKKASDLLPVAGKQLLASELSATVREVAGDALASKSAKKPAKAKAEAEAAEGDEHETAEKDADEGEAKAKAKAEPKKKAKAAPAEVAKNDVEVLFTSFIIQ